jgi:hypothetical protein
MIVVKNERGFVVGTFYDRYGTECSIQKSSLATEDAIWLGVDSTKLTVFEDDSKGKYLEVEMPKNFDVSTRMHLTKEQVKELLPLLNKFVETGELED